MPDNYSYKVIVIQAVCEQLLSRRLAAIQLGISERQVQRLVARFRLSGPQGLVSLKRGKPSNHRLPDDLKAQVLSLVRERYADFGPTLAAEKLLAHHGVALCVETLRGWMIADGLWRVRSARKLESEYAAQRSQAFGELITIGSAYHDWFEERAVACCLLVFMDDATGHLMHLWFARGASMADYLMAVREYLQRHGRPVAFASDKHTGGRSSERQMPTAQPTEPTQLAHTLRCIGIELRPGDSPHVRGRIDRTFKTLRDRLTKEMRLCGLDDIALANRWVDPFIDQFNHRFSNRNDAQKDLHKPFIESPFLTD